MIREWKDVSMTISENMMVYKNKEEKKTKIITRANHVYNGHHESSIFMDLHAGTHIDMPLHMIDGGEDSTNFEIGLVNGLCIVVDFSGEDRAEVDEQFLSQFEIKKGDIVIIKTKNSYSEAFDLNYDYLDASGAMYLKNLGVKAVGIDALGIERSAPGHPTHNTLLGNGIYIIEGLELSKVDGGRYEFICIPLKISGVEGLPARAFLK